MVRTHKYGELRTAPVHQAAAPSQGNTMIWEKTDKEMVYVPAGGFLYAEAKEERELPEFWIDKTPVTNAEYARFVADANHAPPAHWKGKTPPQEKADHPVTYVSWHDARAYCEWLTGAWRAAGRIRADEVARLPTVVGWAGW